MHPTATRRSFLLGGLACPACLAVARTGLAAEGLHWDYESEHGPQSWSTLSPEYRACAGSEQSPVNLTGALQADYPPVETHLVPKPLRVMNNGHTIRVNCEPGSYSVLDGKRYDLQQFHFHHPSEHLLDGRRFEMEAHLVHQAKDGEVAVLGSFFVEGAENSALSAIWPVMPRSLGTVEEEVVGTVDPDALLPKERHFYRYAGSLTTPPCYEIVQWVMFQQPVEASRAQVQEFASLYPLNARPTQPLGRRFLLRSGM